MTALTHPLAASAACYSLGAVAVTILLVVALHKLEPEFDPSWRMLSEYSLGRYGVIMRIAFILGGTGVAACGVALWQPAGLLGGGHPVGGPGLVPWRDSAVRSVRRRREA